MVQAMCRRLWAALKRELAFCSSAWTRSCEATAASRAAALALVAAWAAQRAGKELLQSRTAA